VRGIPPLELEGEGFMLVWVWGRAIKGGGKVEGLVSLLMVVARGSGGWQWQYC